MSSTKPNESAILWRAHYRDGSELWEHNPSNAQKSTYADIDRINLDAFSLFKGDQPLIMVDLRDDSNGNGDIGPKRLIWRKRQMVNSVGASVKIYLVGWQRLVKGNNIQSICFLSESGTVVLGGQWRDDLPLRGRIDPFPWETDLK